MTVSEAIHALNLPDERRLRERLHAHGITGWGAQTRNGHMTEAGERAVLEIVGELRQSSAASGGGVAGPVSVPATAMGELWQACETLQAELVYLRLERDRLQSVLELAHAALTDHDDRLSAVEARSAVRVTWWRGVRSWWLARGRRAVPVRERREFAATEVYYSERMARG